MDNFYRAKRSADGQWVYGIYLPLLDGACMIPDDAAISEMQKTVDGVNIKGHLIETVAIDKETLGLCTGVEDSEGMPVFAGDYVKIFAAPAKERGDKTNLSLQGEVLVKETQEGLVAVADGMFPVNAVRFFENLLAGGRRFTVSGNVYDSRECTGQAANHIA